MFEVLEREVRGALWAKGFSGSVRECQVYVKAQKDVWERVIVAEGQRVDDRGRPVDESGKRLGMEV